MPTACRRSSWRIPTVEHLSVKRALFKRALLLCGLVLSVAACGSADIDPDQPSGQDTTTTDRIQVADIRFDGDFPVVSVTSAGTPVDLFSVPVITMETVFGALTVKPGCNTFFGSFTLAEDGTASFTIAGGSRDPCEELGSQEAAVIDVLGSVTTWTETETGFVFDGPDGDQLTVSR